MVTEGMNQLRATGRRKTAVARVLLRPGNGQWWINGRTLEDYFPRMAHQKRIAEPLAVGNVEGQFDVRARVRGGGATGQADALRLALARAVARHDEELRRPLRSKGLLTRDARKVERKKPGRPKARKRFQFSKR